MKANNRLRINMPRALELISFFFLGHGPTYPISDLSGSAITRGNCIVVQSKYYMDKVLSLKIRQCEQNRGLVDYNFSFHEDAATLRDLKKP